MFTYFDLFLVCLFYLTCLFGASTTLSTTYKYLMITLHNICLEVPGTCSVAPLWFRAVTVALFAPQSNHGFQIDSCTDHHRKDKTGGDRSSFWAWANI